MLDPPKEKEKTGKNFFRILDGIYARKIAMMSNRNVKEHLVQTSRSNGAVLDVTIRCRVKKKSEIRMEERSQLMAAMHFNGGTAFVTLDSDVIYKE